MTTDKEDAKTKAELRLKLRSASSQELMSQLDSLRTLEETLGGEPFLFGEANSQARHRAKEMLREIETEMRRRERRGVEGQSVSR